MIETIRLIFNKLNIKKRKNRRIKPELLIIDNQVSEIDVSEVSKLKSQRKVKRNKNLNENNEDNNDENNDQFGYLLIEKFIGDNYILISPTLEDYMIGNRPLKRKIIVLFFLLIQLAVLIRFIILALINEPWIVNLLADPFYMLGTGNLFFILAVLITFFGICESLLAVYFETKLNSTAIFIEKIMNNQSEYKLEQIYYDKFCKKSKFVIRWVLAPFFRVTTFVMHLTHLFISIKSYLDPDMNFSITVLILTYILLYIWFDHLIATVMGLVVIFLIATLHLKYQYNQIKDKAQQGVKSRDFRLIIKAIKHHNLCSEIVENFNKAIRIALFYVYFCASPSVNILIYLTIYKSINVYMRIIYGLFTFQLFFALYLFTYMASSLSSSAHDLTSDLYAFMFRNSSILRKKIKIAAYIEKLCGRVIGFYCYEWFAFTTIEFYKYIAFISSTYILMSGLLFED